MTNDKHENISVDSKTLFSLSTDVRVLVEKISNLEKQGTEYLAIVKELMKKVHELDKNSATKSELGLHSEKLHKRIDFVHEKVEKNKDGLWKIVLYVVGGGSVSQIIARLF